MRNFKTAAVEQQTWDLSEHGTQCDYIDHVSRMKLTLLSSHWGSDRKDVRVPTDFL